MSIGCLDFTIILDFLVLIWVSSHIVANFEDFSITKIAPMSQLIFGRNLVLFLQICFLWVEYLAGQVQASFSGYLLLHTVSPHDRFFFVTSTVD